MVKCHMSHQNEYYQWPPDTEVVALYSFNGTSKEDLPFRNGDTLTVVKATKDPNWYRARNSEGKEGLIPANYVNPINCPVSATRKKEVKLHAMPWFHGKISRDEAENLLSPRSDGLFLVRESTNYPGDYTLCVCHQGKVEHYRVIHKGDSLTIDEEEEFENLIQLVMHYEQDADGLCTQLLQPLPKQGPPFFVDTGDFKKAGWAINFKDLELGKVLGKGEFGDVLLGSLRGFKEKVAVKRLNNSNSSHIQQFLTEASVMTSLRHPNLVQFIGIVVGTNNSPTYLVTEYVSKGNLVDYLRSRGRNVITRKDQIHFASDACAGMTYLESKNIVHRDLAARNILISDDGTAKVSDFGLASSNQSLSTSPLPSPTSTTGGGGGGGVTGSSNVEGGKLPIKWTAPEALRHNKFTSKSDVWSFGILLWELYSFGRVPYPRIPLADVVRHVESGYRMEAPESCPEEVYSIMRRCWERDPDTRPMFSTILNQLNEVKASTV